MDLLDWAGLTATTAGAALPYTLTGLGFADLAAPLFLPFVDPPRTIHLVIIISTASLLAALPGLRRAIAPGVLLRLGLGSLAGLPLGLVAFRLPIQFHWSAADRAGDPTLVLRIRLCSEPCFPRRDGRHPRPNLALSRDPEPFAFFGGLVGRRLGDRRGADSFTILATLLLGAAAPYTLAAAAGLTVH